MIGDSTVGEREIGLGQQAKPGAVACGLLAAISPFDLALPPEGWTGLFLRPLMLVTGLVSVIIVAIRRANLHKPLAAGCGLVVVALGISAALSDNPTIGYSVTVRLAILCLLFLAASLSFRSRSELRPLTAGLALGVASASTIGLIVLVAGRDVLGTSYLVGSISETNGVQRLTRPFSHTGVAAMYLAPAVGYLTVQIPSLPASGQEWRAKAISRALVATTLIGTLALSLTLNRGGIFALTIALALFLIAAVWLRSPEAKSRPLLPAFVVLTLVGGRLFWPSWTTRLQPIEPGAAPRPLGRPEIWNQALDVFLEHPLLGVGPGQFGPASLERTPAGFVGAPHAHNVGLELLATGGVIVAAAVTGAGLILLVVLVRGHRAALLPASLAIALCTLLLHTAVDYPLPFSSSGNLVALIGGASAGLAHTQGQR